MELRRYWEIMVRRRKLFYWVFSVAILSALFICLVYQYVLFGPVYKISVDLRVDKQSSLAEFLTDAPSDFGKLNSDNFANNILTIAESDPVMIRVGEKLHLRNKSGKPYAPSSFVNAGLMGAITKGRGVTIENIESSEIIQIGGISHNPQEAADIANTYAEEISREIARSNQRMAGTALKYFEGEAPKLKEQLTLAEDSVLAYRLKEHVTDIGGYRTQLLSIQATFETTIYNADREYRENLKRKNGLLDQLKKQPEYVLASQTYTENPQIETLKQNLLNAERQLDSDLLFYTHEHPTVKTDVQQVESVSKQLKEQILKIFSQESKSRYGYYDTLIQAVGDLETDQVLQQARIEVQKDQLNNLIIKLDDLSKKETEYNRLLRIVTVLSGRYANYLSYIESARAICRINVDNLSYFSPAVPAANPVVLKTYIYFPKKKTILILAFALGLIGGLCTIFVVDYIDDRIYDPGLLRTVSQLPVIGEVGKNSNSPFNMQAFSSLDPYINQQIKEIIIHWKFLSGKTSRKESILSLTSSFPNEGKTFLTIALGMSRAQAGDKVLLIDANIISSTLSSVFNITGQENPMPQTVEQAKAQISTTSITNLSVMKLSISQSWDLDKFFSVVHDLQKDYPVILIDTPALSSSRFGGQISMLADQVYIIVRSATTRPIHIQQANETLREIGVTPSGMILNCIKS